MQIKQLLCVLAFAVVVMMAISGKESEALALPSFNLFKRIYRYYYREDPDQLQNPTVLSAIRESLDKVKTRYALAQANMDHCINSDTGAPGDGNLLLSKIVLEELRALRERIEADKSRQLAASIIQDAHIKEELDKSEHVEDTEEEARSVAEGFLESCKSCMMCMGPRHEVDKDDNRVLIDDTEELDDALLMSLDEALKSNNLDDEELGLSWESFSKINRDKYISGAQRILYDLIQNEVKGLALAILTVYLGSASIASLGAITAAIRVKVLAYVIHTVFEFISDIMKDDQTAVTDLAPHISSPSVVETDRVGYNAEEFPTPVEVKSIVSGVA